MKAATVYGLIFEKNYQGQTIEFIYKDVDHVVAVDCLNNEKFDLYYYDGQFVNEEDEFICYTSDLMNFPKFSELNTCINCGGDGYTESYVGSEFECAEKCDCELYFEL